MTGMLTHDVHKPGLGKAEISRWVDWRGRLSDELIQRIAEFTPDMLSSVLNFGRNCQACCANNSANGRLTGILAEGMLDLHVGSLRNGAEGARLVISK